MSAQQNQPEVLSLPFIVQQTIDNNPEVRATFNAFEQAGLDVKIGQGAWRPTVDVNASSAFVDRNYGQDQDYPAHEVNIALSQLLYDGAFTSSNIHSLKQGQVVRFYEFQSQLNISVQDAVIAYLDVLQFRELLDIAEENLKTHISVYKQVEKSASAGVARRADLEQINGRLSLAESNVITEQSNLHDVSARFLRITGIVADRPLQPYQPAVADHVDIGITDTLTRAYTTNPDLLAAIYNIDASRYEIESAKSRYKPRITFNASYGTQSRDEAGLNNSITEARAGINLQYNLYNGGRDKRQVSAAVLRVEQAKDLRDKACRDMRQTIQIAHNDIVNLDSQIPSLNEHRLSSARVRTAYMGQFKLGQRTLLDLLDSENEAYESSRAYTQARYTQFKAVIRLLGSKGTLLQQLDMVRESWPDPMQLAERPVNYDPRYICPALNPGHLTITGNILTQDDDGDGVTNVWDDCPETAPDTRVDMDGCAVNKPAAVIPQAQAGTPAETLSQLDNIEVEKQFTLDIRFAKDTASFVPGNIAQLPALVAMLNDDPTRAVIIEGHTSADGPAAYNLKLGQQRADSLANWLTRENGIDAARVIAVSHGEQRPLRPGNNEDAYSVNRRIEAKVISAETLNTVIM
ncbi:TolC family outer membrane protein [Salinimonas lutimaris]|uniref:TolC family outer membrane protein n=1 Tax=Salinimonas lutimaris TaxID=914153 RepID=UPI0010C0F293|nr:TolC family outer membrane protein [Salinimonas lutimaris]